MTTCVRQPDHAAARAAPDLAVDVLRGIDGFRSIRRTWEELFRRAPAAAPYASPAWVDAWLSAQAACGGTHGGGQVVFVACRGDGGTLLGVLPLVVKRSSGARVARPVGNALPSYLGLLVDPARPGVIDAIADRCASGDLADAFLFGDLWSEDHATARFVAALRRRGFASRRAERAITRSIRLDGDFDAYLSRQHSAKSRQTLRRKERKLYDGRRVTIEWHRGDAVSAAVLGRIARIQQASWMRRRGAAVLHEPFYRSLLRGAADAGLIWTWIMTVDGDDAAFICAVEAGGHLVYQWTAFKLEYEPLSVGQVLAARSIRDACEADVRVYDFSHGDAAYKQFWSNAEGRVERVILGRGVRGRAAVLAYAVALRLHASPRIRETVRRVRRLWDAARRRAATATATAAATAGREASACKPCDVGGVSDGA